MYNTELFLVTEAAYRRDRIRHELAGQAPRLGLRFPLRRRHARRPQLRARPA
jgi:hypothetical protein